MPRVLSSLLVTTCHWCVVTESLRGTLIRMQVSLRWRWRPLEVRELHSRVLLPTELETLAKLPWSWDTCRDLNTFLTCESRRGGEREIAYAYTSLESQLKHVCTIIISLSVWQWSAVSVAWETLGKRCYHRGSEHELAKESQRIDESLFGLGKGCAIGHQISSRNIVCWRKGKSGEEPEGFFFNPLSSENVVFLWLPFQTGSHSKVFALAGFTSSRNSSR